MPGAAEVLPERKKTAIVIGASSGIGRELARLMHARGYLVGTAARRVEILAAFHEDLGAASHVRMIDVSHPVEAMEGLSSLIAEMEGVDIIVVASGVSRHNPNLAWHSERETLEVNVLGFTAMVNVAFEHFCAKGEGQIVGITSFRALRGGWSSPAYNASKAYQANYLEGLRIKAQRMGNDICITEIRPGLVLTPMTAGRKEGLLVAPVGKAARRILEAIERRERVCYVTRRYRAVAWMLRTLPYSVYSRI